MKLIGKLKEDVEKAEKKEEAKKIIEKAGMELTDEEMDQVAGGETMKPIKPISEIERMLSGPAPETLVPGHFETAIPAYWKP